MDFNQLIQGLSGRLAAFTATSPASGGFRPGGLAPGGFQVSPSASPGFSVAQPPQGPQGFGVRSMDGGGWRVGAPQSTGFAVGALGGGGFGVGGINASPWNVQNYQSVGKPPQRPGADGPGATADGGGWLGSGTADDNQGLTGQQVNQFITSKFANSPLAGQGDQIVAIANRYGISVPVLLGIAWKESGMGTNVGIGNIFGITDPSRDGGLGGQRAFQHFSNALAEVEAAARLLASDTYRGKSVADQLSMWYIGKPYAGNAGADDMAGNGTVDDYLNKFIAPTYAALGRQYDPKAAPTRGAGGGGDLAALGPQVAAKVQGVLGTPYTFGGIRNTGNPRDGMDCSSFAGWALGLDRNLWNAQVQYDNTQRVTSQQARPGDLVFFQGTTDNDPSARPVTHVGIYLGNGKMVHTGGAGGVMIVDLNTAYWQQHFYGYGRVRR